MDPTANCAATAVTLPLPGRADGSMSIDELEMDLVLAVDSIHQFWPSQRQRWLYDCLGFGWLSGLSGPLPQVVQSCCGRSASSANASSGEWGAVRGVSILATLGLMRPVRRLAALAVR